MVDEMTYKDEQGNVYKIGYSQVLQEQNIKQLKKNEYLLWLVLLAVLVAGIMAGLVLFQTGIVGSYLARAVC